MLSPERFQELILPYLYDLLDADERTAFENALAVSAEARSGLERARAQQELLATAVREEFPEVTFAAPVSGEKNAPRVVARPPAKLPRRWLRWVAAALIAVTALGASVTLSTVGWLSQKQQLAEATARFDQANNAVHTLELRLAEERRHTQEKGRALQEQISLLVKQWNQEAAARKKAFNGKDVQVFIQSPRALQAGARNTVEVKLRRNPTAPRAAALAQLNASLVDEDSKEVLYARQLDLSKGQTNFSVELPRDLPIEPGRKLAFEVASTGTGKVPVEVREHLSVAAPEYISHLTLDRPMYRPGETIRYRCLTLERFSLQPAQEPLRLRFHITGPNNVEVAGSKIEGTALLAANGDAPDDAGPGKQLLRGIGAGEFKIPENFPGGRYTLHVAEANDRFPAENRNFLIHQWQAPRINKEIAFDRSSYGPGDQVQITARGVPVEGVAPGTRLQAFVTINVDNRNQWQTQLQVGPDGRLTVQYTIPPAQHLDKGNATVAITFDDGGNRETIVRPIPIVLGKLFVDFYPEGGDLVRGVPNRVYFQARTATGKPADLRGRIVDQTGAVIAKVATVMDEQEPGVNQGMGIFAFTPEANRTYELKIDSPTGMNGTDGKRPYVLPEAKQSGVVLRVPQGVIGEALDVEVTSADKDRSLYVGVYCRGKLLDHLKVEAKGGKPATATLRPTEAVGGVHRVTVFEKRAEQFVPLAERLVFRQATRKLELTVAADKKEYYPGERVQLSLKATNEKRELSHALLLVAVVDLSVHKLANDRTARALPTHFLLTNEIRQPEDLEHADFFLGSHPKAHAALDLLLGVQGWRRFAEQDPARFERLNPDAERIVHGVGPGGTWSNHPEKDLVAEVDAKFAPKFVELQTKLADQEKLEAGAPDILQQLQVQQSNMQVAQHQISTAVNSLEGYEAFVLRLLFGLLMIAVLLAGLLFLHAGMRRLSGGKPAAGFFAVGSAILLLLFLGSLGGTFFLMNGHGFNNFEGRWAGRARTMPPAAAAPPVVMKTAEAPVPMPGKEALGLEAFNGADQALPALQGMAVAPVAMAPAAPQPAILPDVGMPQVPIALEAAPRDQMGAIGFERQLRQQGKFEQLLNQRLGRVVHLPSRSDPFTVREFAHSRVIGPAGVRTDFSETLYWHPALLLANGKGEVAFDLSDAGTRFQVVVFGHTVDGRLGATTSEISSRLPVSIEPKVPIEVTAGDTIGVPVAIVNDGNEPATATLTIQPKNLTPVTDPGTPPIDKTEVTLDGKQRTRQLFGFQPAIPEGLASLRVAADFGAHGKDTVERSFKIMPAGFPIVGAHSGLLERSTRHEVSLPQSWLPDTLKCQVQFYPSTLAELQKGLEALLREPCGCFEQSSTSNYPNVLILNYLKEADLSRPEVEARAQKLLTSGYATLTSFECSAPDEAAGRRGYEWFGKTAPPHEALTAYGLLQFKDMVKVYPVDEAMLRRTQNYLLGQRDGKGGFKRNTRALDTFGLAPDHITDAYIVWALTESGIEEDLAPELNTLQARAKDSTDPYFLALVALGHLNRNKSKEGVELLKTLAKFQQEDGHLEGALTSITGSGGRDLLIESTALATLGWLKANRPDEFSSNLDRAVKWLVQQRGGYGGFGATQATILALKALIAHTREHKKAIEAGNLSVFVNDRPAPVVVKSFTSNVLEPITLTIPSQDYLAPGPNRVRLEVTGRNAFPYTLSWSYRTLRPANPENCPVHLSAALQKTEVKEGDTVRLNATVENKSGKGQGMTVAIIGLPGGVALPDDFAQLNDLAALRDQGTKPGVISAWELRGRELVLYWRDLAPDAKIDLGLDLICRLPGVYRGPAPRAYLYYNADKKFWTDPLAITILPAGGGK